MSYRLQCGSELQRTNTRGREQGREDKVAARRDDHGLVFAVIQVSSHRISGPARAQNDDPLTPASLVVELLDRNAPFLLPLAYCAGRYFSRVCLPCRSRGASQCRRRSREQRHGSAYTSTFHAPDASSRQAQNASSMIGSLMSLLSKRPRLRSEGKSETAHGEARVRVVV